MATVSGICRHPTTNAPGAYQVFAHDYYTGALLGSAISDATTGAYSITVPAGSRVRVVRVNAPLVSVGSSLVLGLPMDGASGQPEQIVEGLVTNAYYLEQAPVAGSPAGNAAVFDSNLDWIDVYPDPSLAFSGAFEIGFWVVHDVASDGDYFGWDGTGATPGLISFTAAGDIEWYGIGQSGVIGTYTVGEWSHIAISRDSSGTLRTFLNGSTVQTIEHSNDGDWGNASGDGVLGIGRWAGASSTAFRGKMSGFYMAQAALHTADFTPDAGIPGASIYMPGVPFAASEVIDYIAIPAPI